MKYNCRICTSNYDYCHSCAITKNLFKNAGYCGEDCYHISMALQKYGSHHVTAEETVELLKQHNIENKTLQPSIQICYNKVLGSIVEEVIPKEDVEVVIKNDKDMTISENE